ncbi:MAG: APC family permease [Clostridiales bacterium]|nr:APC family permease [Clostridiales bacterium]
MKNDVDVKSKKKIGTFELSCYGIGNCIGSGIFVSMGVGIGYAGKSICLALVLSCVVVLFAYWYKTLMSGMFALPGGRYAQQALLQPPILVGFSGVSLIFGGLSFAMYGLAIVEYATTVFPGLEAYKQWIALGIITLFFLTTMLGGKFMGRFNAIMVVVLIISLIVYIAVGLTKVDYSAIVPFTGDYFDYGAVGFIMAVAVMSFACQGATMPIDMTEDARNPKKTMPKAILAASAVVMVVYVLIGIVSTGILPVEEVANQNLGVVAESIFPRGVFIVFIIGGACFAIATSLYTTIAGIQYPLMQAVKDGWLPKVFGKTTKKNYPWVIYLIMYIIAVIPIFVNLELSDLISLFMVPTMVLNTINNILMFKLVKKYPNAWKNSFFHMPKWLLNLTLVLATVCSLFITVALLTTLNAVLAIVLVAVVALMFAYVYYRLKTNKVDLTELELAKEQAQLAAQETES